VPRSRVLLIDDEPSFTRMLKLNLERRGFDVRTENNGANAHAVARAFRPDLIFLDVIMPEVDGGEVASQIRSDADLRAVPIVFLTAGVSKEAARVRKNVIGGEIYLAKPASVDEVVRCIERLLGKQAGVAPGRS
jgi:two-component system, OmpR family, response regulator